MPSQAPGNQNLLEAARIPGSRPEGRAGCTDVLGHLAVLEGSSGGAQEGVYRQPPSDEKRLPILSLSSKGPKQHKGHQLDESSKSAFGLLQPPHILCGHATLCTFSFGNS